MATYQNLVDDLRALHPELNRGQVTDKTAARAIWRAIYSLIEDAAELEIRDQRMPLDTKSLSVPADLTTGITLPTSAEMVKLYRVWLTYSTGAKDDVTIIPPSSRNDRVRPVPAAYISGATLYPIPADGDLAWTSANIENAGWNSVSTCTAEFCAPVSEVTALAGTPQDPDGNAIHLVFHRPALLAAAVDLASAWGKGTYNPLKYLAEEARMRLLTTLANPPAGMTQQVRNVRG